MNWIVPWVVVAVFVVILATLFIRNSFVSEATARDLLQQGASVVDVRSPEEFRHGSIPGAINIPLGKLREQLPRCVRDENQSILVHCLSGGRSAIAQRQLKALGYANVFNLGSLARAWRIVCSRPD